MEAAMMLEKQYLGVFYCDDSRLPYSKRIENIKSCAPEVTLDAIFAELKR